MLQQLLTWLFDIQILTILNRPPSLRLLLLRWISHHSTLVSVTMMVRIRLFFLPYRMSRYTFRMSMTNRTGTYLRQRPTVNHRQTQLLRKKHRTKQWSQCAQLLKLIGQPSVFRILEDVKWYWNRTSSMFSKRKTKLWQSAHRLNCSFFCNGSW